MNDLLIKEYDALLSQMEDELGRLAQVQDGYDKSGLIKTGNVVRESIIECRNRELKCYMK